MDLGTTLPAVGASSAAIALALKSPELLKEIYGDLAKPGVSQVGRAIGSILGLGNTALLPIRLLTEAGRAFEQWSFEQIAARFSHIPEDDVTVPPPEVGIPILEKLAYTEDARLREMFIELLAKASTIGMADQVHPSFANVLSYLAPEEAVLLKYISNVEVHPIVTVDLKFTDQSRGEATIHDLIMTPPDGISNYKNIPLFLSNLSGLGIVEIMRGKYLTAPRAYDDILKYAKEHFEVRSNIVESGEAVVEYNKHACMISPYGERFFSACENVNIVHSELA